MNTDFFFFFSEEMSLGIIIWVYSFKFISKIKYFNINKAKYLLWVGCMSDKTPLKRQKIFIRRFLDCMFGQGKTEEMICEKIQ